MPDVILIAVASLIAFNVLVLAGWMLVVELSQRFRPVPDDERPPGRRPLVRIGLLR